MKKGIRYMLLLLIFVNIMKINTYEDKESFQKRSNFYHKIGLYSNNTISVGIDMNKKFSCVANGFIEYGNKIMNIPKRLSLCPYYMFPFKFEFVKILKEIPTLTSSIGKEPLFAVYLLTYYMLYFTKAPKEDIKAYIFEKKLYQYYNCTEIDNLFADSFPKTLIHSALFEKQHSELLKKLGYPDKMTEMELVYKHVLMKMYKSEHMEMIVPWIQSFDDFRWAYGIVMSRGVSVRFNDYLILDRIQENQSKFSKWQKRDLEVNKYISQSFGVPCIIAFFDLCNHYQPKHSDMRDKIPILFHTIPDYFINSVGKSFVPGEEIRYSYSNSPSNAILFIQYGFSIPKNIFNIVQMKIEDDKQLTPSQFNLCKELGCVESNIMDPLNVSKVRYTIVGPNMLDDILINYSRARQLKGAFDQKSVIKAIANAEPYTIENEISAWLFYHSNCRKILNQEKINLEESIYNAQKYKNNCRYIETNFQNDEFKKSEWVSSKIFENIFNLDISYKRILFSHLLGSLNKVIYYTNNELNNIRNSYLTK